ncbi:MAG: hypothetical protein ACK5RO_08645 [Pseudobdellovibrionaceae bacterium]
MAVALGVGSLVALGGANSDSAGKSENRCAAVGRIIRRDSGSVR